MMVKCTICGSLTLPCQCGAVPYTIGSVVFNNDNRREMDILTATILATKNRELAEAAKLIRQLVEVLCSVRLGGVFKHPQIMQQINEVLDAAQKWGTND